MTRGLRVGLSLAAIGFVTSLVGLTWQISTLGWSTEPPTRGFTVVIVVGFVWLNLGIGVLLGHAFAREDSEL